VVFRVYPSGFLISLLETIDFLDKEGGNYLDQANSITVHNISCSMSDKRNQDHVEIAQRKYLQVGGNSIEKNSQENEPLKLTLIIQ
jgi:hypothetical protein